MIIPILVLKEEKKSVDVLYNVFKVSGDLFPSLLPSIFPPIFLSFPPSSIPFPLTA
jgi:hypothetical protein